MTERDRRPHAALPATPEARRMSDGARRALRALHDAERLLALARERGHLATLLQTIARRHADHTSRTAVAIADTHARRLAALLETTPREQLAAAIARLKAEEAAALAQHHLSAGQELDREQQAAKAAFKTTLHALRRSRANRQRRERVHLGMLRTTSTPQRRGRDFNAAPARRFRIGSTGRASRLPVKNARHLGPRSG